MFVSALHSTGHQSQVGVQTKLSISSLSMLRIPETIYHENTVLLACANAFPLELDSSEYWATYSLIVLPET